MRTRQRCQIQKKEAERETLLSSLSFVQHVSRSSFAFAFLTSCLIIFVKQIAHESSGCQCFSMLFISFHIFSFILVKQVAYESFISIHFSHLQLPLFHPFRTKSHTQEWFLHLQLPYFRDILHVSSYIFNLQLCW